MTHLFCILRKYFLSCLSLCLILGLTACGSSDSSTESCDETGTTPADLSSHFEAVSGALVPLVTTEAGAGLLYRPTYDEETDWDAYVSDDNATYLEEIFGDPDSGAATVTKIRVLLDQYASSVEDLVSVDADFSCSTSEAFTGDDEIDVAFFGTVSNGTSAGRYYNCIMEEDDQTVLYGSLDGVVRYIQMSQSTTTNDQDVDLRGDSALISQVVMIAYSQQEVDSVTTGYLDLQYAQATIYEGADGDVLEADDNVLFKSRSRITGSVNIGVDDVLTSPAGDFTITKYDKSFNEDLTAYHMTAQIHGRGDLTEGSHFLFSINFDAGDLPGETQNFCLSSTSLLPEAAVSTNCTTYETAYAWGATAFAFTLDPSISATYDDNLFFENDATGMIADDASNFEISTY